MWKKNLHESQPTKMSGLHTSQKFEIHWASKQTSHFFRATLTKIRSIKINHIWTQISFNSPIIKSTSKTKRFAWVKMEKNAVKSQVIFHKFITETASLPGAKFAADKSRCGDYITRHWYLMNSYCMFWIGGFSWRFSASSLCDF